MGNKKGFYETYGKRILDVSLALPALILFSPILLTLALMVRLKLGSPVLYRQTRPGLREKPFHIYKFRTMTDARDAEGKLLPDEQRLTRFGKALRATSLDELPELWNILQGTMAVVGPRPLLMEYLPLYNREQRQRHQVRPGMTGYAQVNGRNALSWEEKFRMDVHYVKHVGLLLDLKILCATVKTVLKREGINSDTAATMEPFTGNHKEGEE